MSLFEKVTLDAQKIATDQQKLSQQCQSQAEGAAKAIVVMEQVFQRIKTLNASVAEAVQEQTASVSNITSGIATISQDSTAVANAAEQSSQLSDQLKSLSGRLSGAVQNFILD